MMAVAAGWAAAVWSMAIALQLAVLPLLRQHALGVLLQLAEGVAAAVRALHGQAFRLEPSDLAQRREAAGLGLEVEHRQLDRRRPGLAVAVAEPVAPLAAPVELLARDDRLGVGRGHGGGGAGEQADRQQAAGPTQVTSTHHALALHVGLLRARAPGAAGARRGASAQRTRPSFFIWASRLGDRLVDEWPHLGEVRRLRLGSPGQLVLLEPVDLRHGRPIDRSICGVLPGSRTVPAPAIIPQARPRSKRLKR